MNCKCIIELVEIILVHPKCKIIFVREVEREHYTTSMTHIKLHIKHYKSLTLRDSGDYKKMLIFAPKVVSHFG